MEERTTAVERVDVVVVGAGLAGLSAAWHLRNRRLVVLEASDRVGGRLYSEPRGDVWLNLGAHVFGLPASPTGRLIDAMGLEARSVPGRLAAAELHGRIAASGPVELMPFQLPLSIRDRVALIRVGTRLRLAVRRYGALAAERPGDDPDARLERVLGFLDDRSMATFLGPLPPDVDGLFRATLTRSSGEPEELQAGYGVGYFHLVWDRQGGLSRNLLGGSATLTDALSRSLPGPVRLGANVTRVHDTGDGVEVDYVQHGSSCSLRARSAVVAVPAHRTLAIVDGLADDTRDALERIGYGPYVAAAFLTDERRPMPWDRIYALATPQRSFSMLFNTANALRTDGPRTPGGSLMVYAAADAARHLLHESDTEIERRFLDDLFTIFTDARRVVREVVIKRWERGLPFPHPGRAGLQAALTRSHRRIHLAGDYLGTSYTDTAAWTGERAARRAEASLTSTPATG